MKLGTTTIPGGWFASITPSAKQVVHKYDWSNECAITDMGSGPTVISVTGVAMTLAERLAVAAACEEARSAETNLYFASENGETDDYYYRVKTGPMRPIPVTSTTYQFSFTAIALVPYIYDAASGERII